ncbi:transient-receptor-potential-like protein [Trichonephila clavipes]|nr:transient-receptor-potential-like protein [Trichonephila clavipes]
MTTSSFEYELILLPREMDRKRRLPAGLVFTKPSENNLPGHTEFHAEPLIDSSYTSLLWSLFGVIPIKEISSRRDQAFTKWVGHALLGAYMIMAMTVMINMLIAMMSRSFQDIEDHADREWKFARSKLWMSYFDEGSTLPPPFNLIISPKSIYYFCRGIKNILLMCFRRSSRLCGVKSLDGAVIKPEDKSVSYIGDVAQDKKKPPGRDFTLGKMIGKLKERRSLTSVGEEFGINRSVSRSWKAFQTIDTAVRKVGGALKWMTSGMADISSAR